MGNYKKKKVEKKINKHISEKKLVTQKIFMEIIKRKQVIQIKSSSLINKQYAKVNRINNLKKQQYN